MIGDGEDHSNNYVLAEMELASFEESACMNHRSICQTPTASKQMLLTMVR